ncbi:hypothetical protein KAI10_08840, partial [Candidatus Bathyarchaeota archaeon]|nr:hypothetical protein [Candidatus Bathyarchaeota archaeon]
ISVRLSSNTGYFSLELYDTNQQRVDQVSHDGGDSPPVWVTWTATKPGFFYVLSKHFYGSYDTYSLLITGMATPNVPPTVTFVWWTEDGVLYADASGSVDSDGYIASYLWYIDDTGVVDSAEGMTWSWGSLAPGVYELSLRVVDDEDKESDLVVHSVEVTTPPRADAWIIEVKSSDNVIPGGIISVNVTVGYIFDVETVIGPGIWDSDTSSYLKEIEDSVSGEGTETYTLVFEAPLSAGVYSFTTDIPYQTGAGWVWGNESRHVFLINVIDYSSDYIEITDLQFPSSVQTGAEIQVFIHINYELSDDTVAFGILDLDTEEIQTASMIPITGTGTLTVELSFTAPTIE